MCAHLLCLHTQFNVLCQVYRERSQNVEAELASMQAQLSDARRQIQSLTVILTQSAHTIQTALQVRVVKCVPNLEACQCISMGWNKVSCKERCPYGPFS